MPIYGLAKYLTIVCSFRVGVFYCTGRIVVKIVRGNYWRETRFRDSIEGLGEWDSLIFKSIILFSGKKQNCWYSGVLISCVCWTFLRRKMRSRLSSKLKRLNSCERNWRKLELSQDSERILLNRWWHKSRVMNRQRQQLKTLLLLLDCSFRRENTAMILCRFCLPVAKSIPRKSSSQVRYELGKLTIQEKYQ